MKQQRKNMFQLTRVSRKCLTTPDSRRIGPSRYITLCNRLSVITTITTVSILDQLLNIPFYHFTPVPSSSRWAGFYKLHCAKCTRIRISVIIFSSRFMSAVYNNNKHKVISIKSAKCEVLCNVTYTFILTFWLTFTTGSQLLTVSQK